MSKISLSDTKKVGVKTLISYREISEQFPYCSCAKVLYLLSLKKLKDPDFDKVLSRAAVSVPDRKHLEKQLSNFSRSPKLLGNILKEGDFKSNADNRFFSFVPLADRSEGKASGCSVENRDVSNSSEEIGKIDTTSKSHFSIGDFSNIGNTISDIFFTEPEAEKEQLTLTDSLLAQAIKTHKQLPSDIDRFLNNPNQHKAIKVNKNKDYSQVVISDSSTKEDLSIGTETMARLYAQQGHPQKAEIIYRNLIERYPDKILYYNTLIRKLKSQ